MSGIWEFVCFRNQHFLKLSFDFLANILSITTEVLQKAIQVSEITPLQDELPISAGQGPNGRESSERPPG